MNGKKTSTGAFQLVIYVGNSVVPAHQGLISRDRARKLKAAYADFRPQAKTKVVKAES